MYGVEMFLLDVSWIKSVVLPPENVKCFSSSTTMNFSQSVNSRRIYGCETLNLMTKFRSLMPARFSAQSVKFRLCLLFNSPERSVCDLSLHSRPCSKRLYNAINSWIWNIFYLKMLSNMHFIHPFNWCIDTSSKIASFRHIRNHCKKGVMYI